MVLNPDSTYVPRAPRFEVADPCETVVTVTRTGGEADVSLTAKLVDISQHGVKLLVPTNMRFEEALQLQIEILGTELSYQGVASVRHIRSVDSEDPQESWLVGCAIAPPLSDETFSYLATTAGKERRRFRRLPIAAEATIRRQAQTDGCAATLHNLSSGGFCCSSAMHYEVGERIQLTIEDTEGKPRVIEAQICWQVDGPDGSVVGCQFSSRSSYSELCACLTEQPTPEPHGRVLAEPTSRLVLTAAVLAMFLPPMMTLLLQANKVSAEAGRAGTSGESPVVAALKPACPEEGGESPSEATAVASETVASKPPPIDAERPAEFRVWLDNTGKHQTEAKLLAVTEEGVVLQKSNGRNARVPWRRLSDKDQAFAKAWAADSAAP